MTARTTKYGWRYPVGTDANNIGEHIPTLVGDIEGSVAGYSRGPRAARPPLGRSGYIYDAVDDAVYIDRVSRWEQLTPGPWKTWSPTVTLTDGGGNTVANTSYNEVAPVNFKYRVLPGDACEVAVSGAIYLSGTQRFVGLQLTLPIAPVEQAAFAGLAFNDLSRHIAFVMSGNSYMHVFPHGAYGLVYTGGSSLNNPTQGAWPVGNNGGVGYNINGRGSYLINPAVV